MSLTLPYLKPATSTLRLMFALLMDVLKFNPFNTVFTLVLMLLRNISSGIGLLLIIPLLQVIGFSVGNTSSNGMAKVIGDVFHSLHLPLNLSTVLLSYIVTVTLVALIAYVEQWISSNLQHNYTHHLRSQLYRSIIQSTWSFFLQHQKATLVHHLTTQIETISSINFLLLNLINNLILLLVYTMLALFLSWKMTLMAVLFAVLLLGIIVPLHRLTSIAGSNHFQQNRNIFQMISEQINALKMIKISGFENQFILETHKISTSVKHQNQFFTHILAATKLLYSVGSVFIFSILLYMALTVWNIPLTSLMLLLLIFSRILPRASTIQQYYQQIAHKIPSYQNVKQLLYSCMAHEEKCNSKQQESLLFHDAIHLNNISFSYQKNENHPIIQDMSIHIKKNTTTAIMGPSGIGKSTLADLIVGLLIPTSGAIYIDQTELNERNKLAWRKSIAYVTQENFLLNTSIRHNLQLFCQEKSDKELWNALRSAAADEFVARLEQGLDTVIGDSGLSLSGGERQRIALARALLTNPQLLVLDECTSSLDKQNIIKIQHALTKLRGKMTILIITHQVEMNQFADQKIILGAKLALSSAEEHLTRI